ncbi:MAG: class I SAM-dependent methyltransferase [Sporichthyaceae bacterium]
MIGGWSIAAGAIPSPNIWDNAWVYETENEAVDPDGVIETAIDELAVAPGQIGAGWGDVLDVGCGTGFHLPRLAARARSVVGIEPHGGLVAAATRRVSELAHVTVRQGAAQSLPVPDASVDLVHARWAYFFGPGCEPGLREAERVLRRGGLMVVLDHDSTRSSVGRWFAAGLAADGISLNATTVERFWGRHGFARRRLDVRWAFTSRDDLAAVLRIEFPAPVVAQALREVEERGGGWDVDAAVNLWWRRF